MVATDYGKSGTALLFVAGSAAPPTHMAVGTGSHQVVSTVSGLVTEADRNAFTSTDLSVQKQVTHIADFSSTEMSGLAFSEFGVFSTGSATSGTAWNYEYITPITFDGTSELQLEVTFQIF